MNRRNLLQSLLALPMLFVKGRPEAVRPFPRYLYCDSAERVIGYTYKDINGKTCVELYDRTR